MAYRIAYYHNKFCDYVKYHKDYIADAYDTRETYAYVDFYNICDEDTLARINECYKDMENGNDYDEDINDLLEEYRQEHLNEFPIYKREIREILCPDDYDDYIDLLNNSISESDDSDENTVHNSVLFCVDKYLPNLESIAADIIADEKREHKIYTKEEVDNFITTIKSLHDKMSK